MTPKLLAVHGDNGHSGPDVAVNEQRVNGATAAAWEGMEIVYARPESLRDVPTSYCPGCSHGLIHRLIAEVIDEMAIRERTIIVAPVGCAVFAYKYFNMDGCEAPHGRAPAMATGIKRALPGRFVFTYQGDGDLASIGGNEILHAAARGEQITVFFINNTVYGMTGGQLAPTTRAGQVTTSSPLGRTQPIHGYPLHITEMLAAAPGVAYAVRRSTHSPVEIRRTRKAIRTAFEAQAQGLGLALVEILSSCPTNWRLTPAAALAHVRDEVMTEYPLGDFKVHPQLAQS
jgi:2-oxoglutarate ferredoxin oxidoreductase subunit beta